MEQPFHPLSELFAQLGLDGSEKEIAAFVRAHRLSAADGELWQAPWWSPAQAAFLREAQASDSDWAEVVDSLNLMLRD